MAAYGVRETGRESQHTRISMPVVQTEYRAITAVVEHELQTVIN